MDNLLNACKMLLAQHYGAQFQGLLLYGSSTRETSASPMSDIDLLVLLGQPFDYFHELREIVDLLYPVQLESPRLLSAKPVAVDEFQHGRLQLYRNALREGMLV
jgi:uncharacterized protein